MNIWKYSNFNKEMCSTPNVSNLTSWNLSRPVPAASNNNYSLSNFSYHTKPKLLNYRMLIVNDSNKQEDYCSDNMQSKYFLSPLGAFHLTPEECNEILIKRASLAADGLQQHHQNHNSQNTMNHKNPTTRTTSHHHTSDNNVQTSNFSNIKLRPYSCSDCGKTFIQKHHLTTHKKVHSGIRPHSCTHCGKSFTHKHCLNTHLLLHSSDRPYQCNVCKKSFTLKHHLISHAKVHSREKPFICTDCGCAFPLKRHLVTHTKFHAGERPFVCEECGESFVNKDHLVMHSRFHGSTNSFACHECGATFTRKFELVNHSRLHGHVPLSCPVCNKEFMQKRTLVVHMRIHTGETPFHCLTCGEGFHLRNELTLHMATHDTTRPQSTQEKNLSCSDCGSSFNNPEALALHVKLHSGDASFVNDLCTLTANLQGTNFPFHHNFKTKSENSDTSSVVAVKVKSHICKFCSKAFSAKHGLQQHNKRHPEGTCALKSHICDTCNKGFYQKNHLLLHQRQHMDPSLRHPNYTKLQSELETNNSDTNGNFYQDSGANLLDISTKVVTGTQTNGNINLIDKKNNYLLHYEGYSLAKFKLSNTQAQDGEQCKLEPSVEREPNVFVKNTFFRANYGLESLRNVDVKMQISDEITDINRKKSETDNFSVVRQAVV